MKKSTSLDVATLAGVSQAAVSLILNHSDKISFSDDTRERVLEAARTLNYRLPERKRKTERRAGNRLLLVLIPTLTNPFYSGLIQAIEDYADSIQYRVVVCNTFRKPNLEKYYLDTFAGKQVDGIIYTFLPSFPRLLEQINQTTPTVIIGEKGKDLSVCSIELSNFSAGAMVAEHLYQLGHRHFVFLSTPFNQLSMAREQRLEGLKKQLETHGIRNGVEVLAAEGPDEEDSQQSGLPYEYTVGRRLTAQLIRRKTQATAFIGVNDMAALGILAELSAHGKRVPEEYSVCGFDNIFSAHISTPPLSTIDHCLHARCKAAVDMIISNDQPASGAAPLISKIEYAPQLVVRGSTGRAPNACT